jgi:hypothetical protein
MALIVRIDVDRPYGRQPFHRHVCSRLSSDLYFPRIEALGYLDELKTMLGWLNEAGARAYTFFRQCTVPSESVRALIKAGRHEMGLHLEDSRSFDTFNAEKQLLERQLGHPITSMSKHGSGGARYGRRHHAPYEPEKYVVWAAQSGIKVLFGNLEDANLRPATARGVGFYPAAFWLEPHWRDAKAFPTAWLKQEARTRDVVLLVHPENVLASSELSREFRELIGELDTIFLS